MILAKPGQCSDEAEKIFPLGPDILPVSPADLVILAVRIVVAALCPAELVACDQHGHPLREQEGRQHVALLPFAQGLDRRVVSLSLDATIPAEVRAVTVAVVFAVREIVLLLVADEVVQRVAVVSRHEIDAGPGSASVVGEDVAGARKA